MTFTEALQYMLKGSKIRRETWSKKYYIKFSDGGLVVDEVSQYYKFDREDYDNEDWEIVEVPAPGTLLTRYGKTYRLIKDTDDTYTILDEETSVAKTSGIPKEHLMSEIDYQNLSLVKSAKDDIKDGDVFENEHAHTVRIWKLSNGKYIAINSLLKGQTKQELSEFMKQHHLKKVAK